MYMNLIGTMSQSFRIAKSGPTIYQGIIIPTSTTGYNHGDLYLVAGTLSGLYQLTTAGWVIVNNSLIASNNLSDLASISVARTNLGLGTISTQNSSFVVITGGTIDGTTIGAVTSSSGKFTTISSSGLITANSLTTASATITGGFINNVPIGASTPDTGAFTTLNASSVATLNILNSSGATLTGGTINNMSIGATTPSSGIFTTLKTTSTTSSTSTITGSLINAGGFGNTGTAFIGGVLTITNTTASISPTTGSIITDGGLGISGAAFIGGLLSVGGALFLPSRTVTAATTITTSDVTIRYNNTSAAVTQALPATPGNGRVLIIIRTNAIQTVTLTPATGDTINAATNFALNALLSRQSAIIQYDLTSKDWNVVANA